ncbi:HlyD family type I secretion periplasmic adaptor subunit [Arcobacter roscoffensis]|uniref:HlyD family type I secretion periplasmic adaptor subunit n=1 Tax=Arcobacter roscoffensis TaxID=2961520 RepID=A0ABY5E5R3_9BACT|nr:HlyD family type I secretion periplasmic adaptor subunit [Arcobacter roscoffensis]UTJ06927.1 HlyD family type I secretion periplasmic adaptor subunit [Arcobacter roscoffensis]
MKNDVSFVHSLYGQANEKVKLKVDLVFFAIILFVTCMIVWASFAQVDELARGEGKVIPSSKIQTIQSLDGGLIEDILVKSGDKVKIEQALVKIDTTRFQATFEENKESYNQWLTMVERLKLEANIDISKKIPKLNFSKKVKEIGKGYLESQRKLYENRIDELKTSLKVFDSQINQKRQELAETKSKISQGRTNLKLIKAQRATVKRMVESGSKSRIELITVEKEYQQTRGDLRTFNLTVPKIQYAITEAKEKKQQRVKEFRTEASKELERILVEIKKVEARLVADTDKIEKTVIKSNVNGTVKEIYMNTIGGVVKSGVTLMDIIPDSKNLLVEAKIDPKDIAFINPSQDVMIKLTAYDYSIYGGLDGKIVEISADSIVDKDSKDGKSYYKVILETDKNYLEKDGEKHPIIPGMIARVDIVTGKKTIMDFILKPILKVKENSLSEK